MGFSCCGHRQDDESQACRSSGKRALPKERDRFAEGFGCQRISGGYSVTVDKTFLTLRAGALPSQLLGQVENGLRLVLEL